MDKAAIKQKVCEAIAAHRADIEAISEAILAEPELGFKEVKTSRKVQERSRDSASNSRPATASRASRPA